MSYRHNFLVSTNSHRRHSLFKGSSETLHGELDMIAEGVVVTVAENLPNDEDVDIEDEVCETEDEGGETVEWGAEENLKSRNVRQLRRESSNSQRVNGCVTGNTKDLYKILSETIVFGWTEFNRHRELGPYIPSVFTDDKQFGFAVYNPVTDCLVLGKDYIPFFGPESEYPEAEYPGTKYAGIFILWLILHNRLFFRNEMDLDFECNFKPQVNVNKYEELQNYESSVRDNSVLFKFGTNFGLRIPKRKQLKRKHSEIESNQPSQ